MNLKFTILLMSVVIGLGHGQQRWFNFKIHFDINPVNAFHDQPKTESDAINASWIKVNSWDKPSKKFNGIRYVPCHGLPDRTLLFDKNGYIAGMQSVVPKNKAKEKYYKFSEMPIYVEDTINGIEVFTTTAYFVDPDTILEPGRTDNDFRMQGTGYTLIFQNGKTPDRKNLLEVPMKQGDVKGTWFKHNCFIFMGDNYFQTDTSGTKRCDHMFPVQLKFDPHGEQALIGFAWQHTANLFSLSENWEVTEERGISLIVKNVSQCLVDRVKKPGISTMHVYFLDWKQTCSKVPKFVTDIWIKIKVPQSIRDIFTKYVPTGVVNVVKDVVSFFGA